MSRPSPDVLHAFESDSDPIALSGGRGLAWRVGDLVFKPADLGLDELAWQADVLPAVHAPDIRLSTPQRATGGDLVVDGWTAWSFLPGEHQTGRWLEIIAIGDRFHRAVAGLARPAFIAARMDPWAIGDRVAWGEAPIDPYLGVPHVARLAAVRHSVDARSQLIHGDLTGNVLFADDMPPAVIDLSPYWRPTAFATAIVLADALVWEGADESLLASVADVDDVGQMLIRALIYRLVAAIEGGFEEDTDAIDRRYRSTVTLAIELAARR
jgi:uncharacterized protein (TIGR02569 family)